MEAAEHGIHTEAEDIDSPRDNLDIANSYSHSQKSHIKMNNENIENSEDGSAQGLVVKKGKEGGTEGSVCGKEGSACESDIDINDGDGDNTPDSLGFPSDHTHTSLPPDSLHCYPESHHQSVNDQAADRSQGGPSHDAPSVSSSHPSPEVSNVYSVRETNRSDISFVSDQSVLSPDQSQDVQSSDVPPSPPGQPDQLAGQSQGKLDHSSDHSCAVDRGSDGHHEKNRRAEVNGHVVRDSDSVRDKQLPHQEKQLPHSQSECEESVTVCCSSLLKGADDDQSGREKSADHLKDSVHIDRRCPTHTDSGVCAAAGSESIASGHVEVASSVSNIHQSVQIRDRVTSIGDCGQSTHPSLLGIREESRTAAVASCHQRSDNGGHGAAFSDTDACAQSSPQSPGAGISALSDSCVQETRSHSAVESLSVQEFAQTQHSIDSCLQHTDSPAQSPAGELQMQEASNVAVADGKSEILTSESTQNRVTKSPEMFSESTDAKLAITNTSSMSLKTSSTNKASEELGGSSVDPEPSADQDALCLQGKPELLNPELPTGEEDARCLQNTQEELLHQEGEGSDSSENDFEDVTSTPVQEVETYRGSGGKDQGQSQGYNVSHSDEGSDDDDFFDAFDEQSESDTSVEAPRRAEHSWRQTTDDHLAESESQSSSISSTDHGKANDLFLSHKNTDNASLEEDDPSTSSTGSTQIPGSQGRKGRRRERIPDKPHISLNLWSVLKNCIGKELSKIPMPVNFSEPLSMLQRLTEELEYSEILDRAALCEDTCEQMAHVAAFTVSAYATTQFRIAKPFNPLLGETFEFDRMEDLGWRSFAEQVSHHPPALAIHAEGRGWTLWQDFTMTIRFRGRYVQIIPMGMAHLRFSGSGQQYTWRKVTTTVHNIIVGRLWVDNEGLMDITNHTTGDVCHLHYHPYSYFSRQPHRKVTGQVKDSQGVVRWTLNGTWNSQIEASPMLPMASDEERPEEEEEEEEVEEDMASSSCYSSSSSSLASKASRSEEAWRTGASKVLWSVQPPPEGSEKTYHFSRLATEMNEPEEGVAPTDSRLRPDQRQMEEGNWDEANRLKFLLEEKQRETRRRRQTEAEEARLQGLEFPEYQPVWFRKEVDPVTGNSLHVFTGDYWTCKETQQWDRCPDIFL